MSFSPPFFSFLLRLSHSLCFSLPSFLLLSHHTFHSLPLWFLSIISPSIMSSLSFFLSLSRGSIFLPPTDPGVNQCNPPPTPAFLLSWWLMLWLHPHRCQSSPPLYVLGGQFDSGLQELLQHLWASAPPESSRAAYWKKKKKKKRKNEVEGG